MGNLPAELTAFLGRRAELVAAEAHMARSRLVTVTGPGGVGKSRLALQTARRTQDGFRDGVRFADLSELRDPAQLARTVAEAVGLPGGAPRSPRSARAALAEHLAGRELLLVVDGFDRVREEAAALIGTVLRRAPGLRVLAAGRRPLGLTGERLLPLAPLTAPGEAVALFAERAAEVVPGFRVDSSNAAEVAELCARLDGLPLALELAAARLRALSVGELLDRLDDRFRLLAGGDPAGPERHRALRTTVGWSHELCTPEERLLWARLSAFAGSFELEAAEYVCAGPDLAPPDVAEALEGLVAQSVVVREVRDERVRPAPGRGRGPDGGDDDDPGALTGLTGSGTPWGVGRPAPVRGTRYRLLESVREYGAWWLAELGDVPRMRRRHRDWYLGLATWCELEWLGPRQPEVAARVTTELPNLRAALELSLDGPGEDPAVGQYLAGTLWFCWVGCGRLAEGRHWLRRALDAGGSHGGARAKAMGAYGGVALLQGDFTAAFAVLRQCREEAAAGGNATAEVSATHQLGYLALLSDDAPAAERFLAEALYGYQRLGLLDGTVLMGQVGLAMAAALQGDVARAARLAEETRELCLDRGEQWARTYALYVLAYTAWLDGASRRARRLAEQALSTGYALHDLLGSLLALDLLVLVTEQEGAHREAAVLQGATTRLWDDIGPRLFGSRSFTAPHTACEQRVRHRLGDRAYAEALREGGRLSFDATARRALTPRACLPRPRSATTPLPR
nr:AAA family ATPase [Actinacidiphila yeochonensis]